MYYDFCNEKIDFGDIIDDLRHRIRESWFGISPTAN